MTHSFTGTAFRDESLCLPAQSDEMETGSHWSPSVMTLDCGEVPFCCASHRQWTALPRYRSTGTRHGLVLHTTAHQLRGAQNLRSRMHRSLTGFLAAWIHLREMKLTAVFSSTLPCCPSDPFLPIAPAGASWEVDVGFQVLASSTVVSMAVVALLEKHIADMH